MKAKRLKTPSVVSERRGTAFIEKTMLALGRNSNPSPFFTSVNMESPVTIFLNIDSSSPRRKPSGISSPRFASLPTTREALKRCPSVAISRLDTFSTPSIERNQLRYVDLPLLALPLAPPALPMSMGDWLSTRREHMQAPITSFIACSVSSLPLLMDSKNSSALLRGASMFSATGNWAIINISGVGSIISSFRTS